MDESINMISIDAVARKCDWRNRVTVYRTAKRDPTFPRPRKINGYKVAWVEAEVDEWLRARPLAPAYINSAA